MKSSNKILWQILTWERSDFAVADGKSTAWILALGMRNPTRFAVWTFGRRNTACILKSLKSAEKLLHENEVETTTNFVMYFCYGVGKGRSKFRRAP